jgi:hypothetical protein
VHEVWQPVQGYEGLYEVSDQGRVRSLDRWSCEGQGRRWIKERVLAPVTDKDGYQLVTIKGKLLKVHRLVMLSFCGTPPEWATMVNHIDKDPSNNALSNLEWSHNGHNKRHANRRHQYKGQLYCLSELSEISGLTVQRLYGRIVRLGWSVTKAVETPLVRPPDARTTRPNPLMDKPFWSTVAQ